MSPADGQNAQNSYETFRYFLHSQTTEEMENQNKSAEFWIKNLNLVEHPEHKDGFFAVPFEDDFKVLNKNKVKFSHFFCERKYGYN